MPPRGIETALASGRSTPDIVYTLRLEGARILQSMVVFGGAHESCPSRCAGKGSGGALKTAATDVWLNSGPGQRLDGRSTATSPPKSGLNGGGSAGGGGSGKSTEDMQLAMAISASMGEATAGGMEGAVGGSGGGGEDDDVARAIALSLSQEGSAGSSSSPSTYTPQPVPELQPKGPDVVRVQVR